LHREHSRCSSQVASRRCSFEGKRLTKVAIFFIILLPFIASLYVHVCLFEKRAPDPRQPQTKHKAIFNLQSPY